MPRNSRALLSVEIRTAANRGPPRPLLSWAFRRFGTFAPIRNETGFPVPVPSRLVRPNSTSPSLTGRSGTSRPADDPVPKNQTAPDPALKSLIHHTIRLRRTRPRRTRLERT